MLRLIQFLLLSFLAATSLSGQIQKHRVEGGISFLELLPDNYQTSNNSYPLLIYLHGIGERGDGSKDQIQKVKIHGLPKLIESGKRLCFNVNEVEQCFIVISPQLPTNAASWNPMYVNRILEHILKEYRVNTNKIYLTGISLGGTGAWAYSYSDFNKPNKLAAIVPVAAWGRPNEVCKTADRGVKVWAFHGAIDKTIKLVRAQSTISAFDKCMSENKAKFTIYDNVGHNSWDKAYALDSEENLFEWLLVQQRGFENTKASKTDPPKLIDYNSKVKLPINLREISGMVPGKNQTLWVHNDSGDLPNIYQIDLVGNILRTVKITYAANFDWEDMTRDKEGNLYIGDIGNNKNTRKSFQIYKIDNPDNIESNRIPAKKIEFTLNDQIQFPPINRAKNFDMEAMVAIKDSLYIFTKNRTKPFNGYTKIYGLPNKPGKYSLNPIDSILINTKNMSENWITAATMDPTLKNLYLLTHNKVIILYDFNVGQLQKSLSKIHQLTTYSQKEAICFPVGEKIYIADELFNKIIGGNLYSIELRSFE